MKIAWPPGLFLFPEGDGAIDLTGRARIVVHGPHQPLKAGEWRIAARFSVDTEGHPIVLRFEWGGAHDVTGSTVTIATSGLYEMNLDYDWPAGGPAALRVWVAQPTFAGRLTFLGAEVEGLSDQSAPNRGPMGTDTPNTQSSTRIPRRLTP